MRRKVIQDFANVFCQKFVQLPSGYDLATFAYYGSGKYSLNILTGNCFFDDSEIPTLETCKEFKGWLAQQTESHHFSINDIKVAKLEIKVKLSNIVAEKVSINLPSASAFFSFDCNSEIETDEKTYTSNMIHEQKWEFGYFYRELYVDVFSINSAKIIY